jgi:hypothetical protein
MSTTLAASLISLVLISGEISSQFSLSKLLNKIAPAAVTEAEAGQGIKEALTQGVTTAVLNLHKEDGFFGSEVYKVLLPPDAKKVESTARKIGLGRQVDKAILAINRGAEDAVGSAKPIFVDAIREMTVTDALGIVRGNKNAATEYFRQKTSEKLVAAFSPSVKASLDKTYATKYYSDIVKTYNALPTTFDKANPDLTSYVVGKTVDALFDQVAQQEAEIRANPLARTTEILKKVFGAK